MQTAPNPRELCQVCGVHPALAASEGAAQRAALTQIGRFLAVLQETEDTAASNFHIDAGQSYGWTHV